MIESLIVIIPTFIAFCFVVSKAKSHDKKKEAVILFFAMCMLWMHFFAQGVKWFEPYYPDWLAKLRCYTSSLALPFSYMVVCQIIGKKHFSVSTVVVFLLVLLNLIQYGIYSFDSVPPSETIDLQNICFLSSGKVVFSLPNYCLVMLCQSIWIFYRTAYLSRMVGQNNYHSSPRAKIVLRIMLVLLFSIMIAATIPDTLWAYNSAKYIFFAYFALGFSVLLVLVGKDFVVKPILDSNNEPAYLDRKPRFDDLEIKCRQLYEEEKIYLIPSLKLEDLALRLGTNRSYTAELMRKNFNATFASYTNSLRVEYAKKAMIENPGEKLEVIANMCGFATAPTFTKVFKNATGYTPSNWITMKQQENNGNKIKEEQSQETGEKQDK